MDESTMKRMEQKQMREQEADYGISLTEYNYGQQVKISWLDIINYVSEKFGQGVSRMRVKELFLQEVVDPEIERLNIDLSKMELNIEMQKEAEKYNY